MKLGTNDIGSVYLGTNAVQKVYLGVNEVWTSFTGLLDDYPNAAVAYSLRRLSGAYTGSAMQVRRSSDNTVSNIGFLTNGQLDTTALLSFVGTGATDDGFITEWYDQSGNERNASQGLALNQPKIVSGGSVILDNGNPIITPSNGFEYLVINNFNFKNVFYKLFNVLKSDLSTNVLLNAGAGYFIVSLQNSTSTTISIASSNTTSRRNSQTYSFTTRGQLYTDTVDKSLFYIRSQIVINPPCNLGYYDGNTAINMFSKSEFIVYPDSQTNVEGIETNINEFYNIY